MSARDLFFVQSPKPGSFAQKRGGSKKFPSSLSRVLLSVGWSVQKINFFEETAPGPLARKDLPTLGKPPSRNVEFHSPVADFTTIGNVGLKALTLTAFNCIVSSSEAFQ